MPCMTQASGRVLGRLRLSVATDESTSIARQREAITAWAESNGSTVVGWAEDSDVSGSVDPFDAPQLGDWLNNRADEFDVIAAWKLDRLSRNSIKLNKLFGWCLDHGKSVVSTSEAIDLGTPVGRLIANVIGFLAEGELEAIRERTISSRRKLRETARWAGGRPPYGYRPVDGPHGGKVLEIDPEAHSVVRRIVDALLDEVPLARIADELNRDGIKPPADHYRVSVGKEPIGSTWKPAPMRKMLQAPTLVGHAHLGGVAVRDDQGQPVRMAEPLVTEDERELIRAELARTEKGTYQRLKTAPLVGVLYCWFCEAAMSSSVSKGKYRYYRCHKNGCTTIHAETAEEEFERFLLGSLGDEQVTERVWVPGDSHEVELRAAIAAFDELSAAAGTMTSRTAKDRLQRQIAALDARIAELEKLPSREGRYEHRATGETYRQAWEKDTDPDARRALLKRIGVDFRAGVHEGHLLSHVVALGDRLPEP
ncbi:recombinase family protein [soil metagenome]